MGITGSGACVYIQRCEGAVTELKSLRTTLTGMRPAVVDAPTSASQSESACPLGNDVSTIPVSGPA